MSSLDRRTIAVAALAIASALVLQGNVYLAASADAGGQSLRLGASDGPTGDIGPAEDPIPVSSESSAALERTVQEMTERWRELDRNCDPAAVFSLLYLETTEAVTQHIRDGYFNDNEFLAEWTIAFADRYEEAIDAWMAGETDQIEEPWLDAFQRAEANQTSVSEDVLLGINVHIHYDLGLVTERLDIVEDQRKEDYDRINDVLQRVSDPATKAVAKHYDPSFDDSTPADPVLDPANQMLINAWREEAWTDAEVLTNAPDASAEDAYQATMEQKTLSLNAAIDATNPDPDTQSRIDYCEQQNAGS